MIGYFTTWGNLDHELSEIHTGRNLVRRAPFLLKKKGKDIIEQNMIPYLNIYGITKPN